MMKNLRLSRRGGGHNPREVSKDRQEKTKHTPANDGVMAVPKKKSPYAEPYETNTPTPGGQMTTARGEGPHRVHKNMMQQG